MKGLRLHLWCTIVFVLAGFLLSVRPAGADGFCCLPSKLVKLHPTAEGVALGLVGKAEIDECYGMSFLRVRVSSPSDLVPRDFALLPVIPGAEPLIGDWFYLKKRSGSSVPRGSTVMEGITLLQLTGRTVEVADSNFTTLLIGQF